MEDSTTTTPAETVHAHELSDVPTETTVAPGQKVCCVCGKDVRHEERFKDKKGRYWCYECGVADSHKRHGTDSVKCPECNESFSAKDLVEYEGHHLCPACAKKHAIAAKRQASRQAAAVEAEHRAQIQWKLMIGGAVAFAVIAIALVVWRVF